MGNNNTSVSIEVIDFVLDEKYIKQHSFERETKVDTHFDFELINQPTDNEAINAVFKTQMKFEYIKESNDIEDKKVLVEASITMQMATFVTNIDSVNLKAPSEKHITLARNAFYPIARSMFLNELNLIQRNYSDIPYSI